MKSRRAAFIVSLCLLVAGCGSTHTAVSPTRTTTSVAPGMQLVKYHDLQLQVPSDWTIKQSAAVACPTHSNKVVYIEYRDSGADCAPGLDSTNLTLFLDTPTPPFDPTTSTTLKYGDAASIHSELTRDPRVVIVRLPSESVQLTFVGPFNALQDHILDTIKKTNS